MEEGQGKKKEVWAIRQRTVKKEGEGRAGTGKWKKRRGLRYEAKNSEEGRRRKGGKRETERRKRTGL